MCSNVFDCSRKNRNSLEEFNCFMEDKGPKSDLETYINGQVYYKNIIVEEIDVVVRIICKNWCYLQSIILSETTSSHNELASLRAEINKCLKLIIHCLKSCDSESRKKRYLTATEREMQTFSSLILPPTELDKNIHLKLTSPSSSKEKCPIYQYFHCFLDIQYYLLVLDYTSGNTDDFKRRIHFIIGDFIVLSKNAYRQNSKSPFMCHCNENFWLIFQFLCNRVLGEDSFWYVFNKIAAGHDGEYVLWLLQAVGNLEGYDMSGKCVGSSSDRIKPNFSFLESTLKNLIAETTSNKSIMSALRSVEPLVCDLWLRSTKIEIYQILWEHFGKRLNTTARSVTQFTLNELIELSDTILCTPKNCEYDFELFLSMLCIHLKEHPYQWSKIKGRIYSHLRPDKIKDLNTVGIFHVMLLFISMTKVNFEELSKKFISFLENLPVEKRQSQMVWNFYKLLIVRYVRENRSIEPASGLMIRMLEEASTDQKQFHLIKNFVTDFDDIMRLSENLQLHQWLLINSWIHQYMTTCYYPDLQVLLQTLVKSVDSAGREVWCDWELTFKNYVYPTLKYVASSRSASDICGVLAGKIAILCPNVLPEALIFFNGETISPNVSRGFLCVILENYPNCFILTQQQEAVAVQSWVKICLLTRHGYENLTRNISKLDLLPSFVKTAIASVADPLCSLIDKIGLNIRHYAQSESLIKLCETFFGQADRWITQYLGHVESEAVVLRIYTCIGLAFYKMGPLLYNKHKSNCPYARLVSAILLPAELVVGKPLHPHVLQAIKKTWHLFFEATYKLNTPNDAFIDRVLREMIVRYVPHFSTGDSPMLKCLDNENTAEILLEKMSVAFFRQPTAEADSNVSKTLRMINDFVQSTTSSTLFRMVVNKTLFGVFETAMFHSQHNMALSVIKNVTASPLKAHARTEFEDAVMGVTEKHLAFKTLKFFELMGILGKLTPNSVKELMPRIKQHIANVERMRGVAFDKTLRLQLGRLEANLLQVA